MPRKVPARNEHERTRPRRTKRRGHSRFRGFTLLACVRCGACEPTKNPETDHNARRLNGRWVIPECLMCTGDPVLGADGVMVYERLKVTRKMRARARILCEALRLAVGDGER